ncbi:CinA family protein [Streptomyces sp. NPDC017941]|uniref:CinA family protein n=1 Tax=Streptomyces sp. NPDC017941 TaxID=3365018 RepID=UPI0037AFF1BE
MLAKSAAEVLRVLGERGETLAAAESLTGGLVAAEVTAAPGASQAFKGSVTSYATEVKRDLLGVDADLLAERGAVDGEVALQMAVGVRELLGTDWGVATTGVAGPERQDGQPVGTVFVAVAGPAGRRPVAGAAGGGTEASDRPGADGCLDSASSSALRSEGKVAALRLNGNRTEIRMESVRSVLELLLDQLSGERTGNGRTQDTEQNGGT